MWREVWRPTCWKIAYFSQKIQIWRYSRLLDTRDRDFWANVETLTLFSRNYPLTSHQSSEPCFLILSTSLASAETAVPLANLFTLVTIVPLVYFNLNETARHGAYVHSTISCLINISQQKPIRMSIFTKHVHLFSIQKLPPNSHVFGSQTYLRRIPTQGYGWFLI